MPVSGLDILGGDTGRTFGRGLGEVNPNPGMPTDILTYGCSLWGRNYGLLNGAQ